jgi:hypothetical protein
MIHFATEQSANMRQRSVRDTGAGVRDVLEAFEEWCDRQVFTAAQAMHADHALRYLAMAAHGHLPPCLVPELARHVEAIAKGRL